ncbi:hypothetical protein IDAT_07415 [Pseudidiomarina atlantica]|uniref:Toxin HigB-2 n=1 Tax=Pseudidiomarina atlantica TaxID=1517416 RepID=A0A094IRS7_9GAMM|nr:type II toxin-antitoxin system RelE/ParE family toxin [Pseudidiomarina atlantica]KFZ28574.1 hypothetical protein IDAT_07415 [Pseudidiomarina atlantica]
MQFIETPIFTKRIKSFVADEDYRLLQVQLALNPIAGAVIKGSGGIRKLRWSGDHKGKRGSYRILYYYANSLHQVWMLFVFAKNEQSDLSPDQLKTLRRIVENWQP